MHPVSSRAPPATNNNRQSVDGVPASSIQIIGSDTMVNLVQAWAEAFLPNPPVGQLEHPRRRLGHRARRAHQQFLRSRHVLAARSVKKNSQRPTEQHRTGGIEGGARRARRHRPSVQSRLEPHPGPVARHLPGKNPRTGRNWAETAAESSSSRGKATRAPTSSSRSTCCGAATRKTRTSFPRTPCSCPHRRPSSMK